MDKLLLFNAKSDLLRIYFNHLCCRWRISKLDLLFMISTIFFILNLPLLLEYIQNGYISVDISALMIYSCIYLLVTSSILFFISNIHNRNMIKDIKHEVNYSVRVYNFIYSIYDSIINHYTVLRSSYNFVIAPTNDIRKKDDIVVNIVLIKLFTLYFHNVDNNSEYGKVKSETLQMLFRDMKFEEFYNSTMFDIKNIDSHNMVKIILIDAVIQELLKKKWFEEYYESKNIERLVDFILKQWYATFLKYYYKQKN